jgi:hypothetical protein
MRSGGGVVDGLLVFLQGYSGQNGFPAWLLVKMFSYKLAVKNGYHAYSA